MEKMSKEECQAALIHMDIVERWLKFQLENLEKDRNDIKSKLEMYSVDNNKKTEERTFPGGTK